MTKEKISKKKLRSLINSLVIDQVFDGSANRARGAFVFPHEELLGHGMNMSFVISHTDELQMTKIS